MRWSSNSLIWTVYYKQLNNNTSPLTAAMLNFVGLVTQIQRAYHLCMAGQGQYTFNRLRQESDAVLAKFTVSLPLDIELTRGIPPKKQGK